MTTVAEPSHRSPAPPTTGRVVRVIGPVVDIEFPRGGVPALFNALHATVTGTGDEHVLTLEVALHLGDDIVRSISMQPTDGLVRGTPVKDTGAPISVPVGDAVKGHVFNALGVCLDVPGTGEDAGDNFTVHIPDTARDALINGAWDPIGELLDSATAVATTAEAVGYMTPR